ncbi:MAG: rhodanese-related sulfurtransferase [Gammaproteobacteria bacterium]|jgi:UPF0176 protein|nr:rhodanese-related sulfurtransferase [Gammaproteobacteria bacterium]GIS86615.1 MAG: UPF0176 protein [Woeseia sp.]
MEENKLIAAFYKFVDWNNLKKKKSDIEKLCLKNNIVGTILLANEGINGTIAGSEESVLAVIQGLKDDPLLLDIEPKFSKAEGEIFKRMKVRFKKEIVSMGMENIRPANLKGKTVKASDWNALISNPKTLVIDTRNQYECAIGTFKGSLDPKTKSFREFPKWSKNNLKALMKKEGKTKVAMFCTGGIRCEKASSYLLGEGIEQVYQLEGGILKYLENISSDESLWEGECFVFDERVSIQHGLVEGNYSMCHACRMPIDDDDMKSKKYSEGISCPHCYATHSEERKERFAERQKQIKLAKIRNEKHLGKTY